MVRAFCISKENDPRQFPHLTVEEFLGVTELKDQH